MTSKTSRINNRQSKIILGLSIASAIFWWLSNTVNLYQFAVTGAIFEILWLPMLALIHILPVLCLVMTIIQKFNYRSYYFISFWITSLTLTFMYVFSPY